MRSWHPVDGDEAREHRARRDDEGTPWRNPVPSREVSISACRRAIAEAQRLRTAADR